MIGAIYLVAFAATIPVANWMIGNVGECLPNGPCLIPVGFGLMAPSGVLMIGLSLVLRDAVHSLLGLKWAAGAIAVGGVMSLAFSPASLVVASVIAFLLSEIADLAVYSPLHSKRLVLAVLVSGVLGAVVDSAVFLLLAFGSLEVIEGQVLGKFWMTFAAAIALAFIRVRPPQ